MRRQICTLAIVASIGAGFGVASAGTVGAFRVLPYQTTPTTEGVTLTWFTIDEVAGQLTVVGPGLDQPLVIASTPELQEVLDYQSEAELNAGGAFPFEETAVFEAPGVPARNYKHQAVITGLTPDSVYNYSVEQNGDVYSNTFRTAPTADLSRPLRFAVLADSETLVSGRTTFREWAATTPQSPESTGRPENKTNYFLTETVGYQENLKQIDERDPDLIIMPGDLIQGTSSEQQRRWDEFWRHNAGQYDDVLSSRPLVAAIGNNCIFNGGAGGFNPNIQYARQQWSAYFDFPSNGTPEFQDLYHRTDYGPVTIITINSTGALPPNDDVAPPVGQDVNVNFPENLDTNRSWFTDYPFGDLSDFNVGTTQYDWVVQQLEDARAAGRIILVQWHHTPYSRGVHGSSVTSNQSGEAMRIYAPLLEQYRVAALFCGHSEVSEQSFFDLDADGYGVHLWDTGAAGDGLRGVEDAPTDIDPNIQAWWENPLNPLGFDWNINPFSVWTADQAEAETWDGNRLISGGKHYGFLEVDVEPLDAGEFRLTFQYWHNFPLNAGDEDFTVTGFELRPYSNRVVLEGPADNLQPVPAPPVGCGAIDLDADGVIGSTDLNTVLLAFGVSDAGDIDGDGATTSSDLNLLLGAFGNVCN